MARQQHLLKLGQIFLRCGMSSLFCKTVFVCFSQFQMQLIHFSAMTILHILSKKKESNMPRKEIVSGIHLYFCTKGFQLLLR